MASDAPFTLPELPWAPDALEPHTSAKTISFHHGKHHAGYVRKLNAAVSGTDLGGMELDALLLEAHKSSQQKIFNLSAQAWNHAFFWQSMAPGGGGKPGEGSAIAKKVESDFGSFEAFQEQFKAEAATHFGSGWGWLVLDNDSKKLSVVSTHDAGNPLTTNQTPILTLDVWEHAYYLDYQNRRPDFITTYLDNLVNWDFAEANLTKALNSQV